jgi:Alcohol dehydrogenase GroES-like domain
MTEQIRGPGSPTESGRTSPADPAGQPGRGSGEMLAMVLTNDRKTRLERRPVPTPRDDQVLVDIDLCGICGSDLHAPDLREVYLGGFIMGHEPAGRIAGVGRDVSGWRVGQRWPSTRTGTRAVSARRAAPGDGTTASPRRWNGLWVCRPTAHWRHTWRSHPKLCMRCRTRWAAIVTWVF